MRVFNRSGLPDRAQYPVVADPDGSDLNQLYLEYAPDDAVRMRFGRQRILLDDQRFVGGVGWAVHMQNALSAYVNYDITVNNVQLQHVVSVGARINW